MAGQSEPREGPISIPAKMLQPLQARVARSALGPSSMRGAGNKGVAAAGREYLVHLDLRAFGVRSPERFSSVLDHATKGLVGAFPKAARHWGLARKGLNIFLRECLYTIYLREAYRLDRAEAHFEVPLDSITGNELYLASGGRLPRWQSVRGLSPDVSQAFQEVAAHVAARRRIARVHLDALWWGERRRA